MDIEGDNDSEYAESKSESEPNNCEMATVAVALESPLEFPISFDLAVDIDKEFDGVGAERVEPEDPELEDDVVDDDGGMDIDPAVFISWLDIRNPAKPGSSVSISGVGRHDRVFSL